MVLLQPKNLTELFVKIREFLPGSKFPSHQVLTLIVKSDVGTNDIPLFSSCVTCSHLADKVR